MRKYLVLALLPAFVVGCAPKNTEYPRATMYPDSTQQKMQAVAHWNVLAENEAKLIAQGLPGNSVVHISCTSNACDGISNNTSPFGKAYKELLTTHLVNKGVLVAPDDEAGTYSLSYNVQVVTHNDRGGLPLKTGVLAGGSVAAYGIYQATTHWDEPALIAIPLVIAGEVYNFSREETESSNSEVLVTTKITKNNRVFISDSRVYYFNAGDASHYENKTYSAGMAVTNIK